MIYIQSATGSEKFHPPAIAMLSIIKMQISPHIYRCCEVGEDRPGALDHGRRRLTQIVVDGPSSVGSDALASHSALVQRPNPE